MDHIDEKSISVWKCLCDCGNEVIINHDYLINRKFPSCGCAIEEKKLNEVKNKRSGRLTATEYAYTKGRHHYWKCVCDCGKEVFIDVGRIRRNEAKSCGCYMRELASTRMTLNNPMKLPANRERMSRENPMKRLEISERNKGNNNPACRPEVRAKISKSSMGKHVGKKSGRYGKTPAPGAGRGKRSYFTKNDGKTICFRSTFEARMANILETLKIMWVYETRIELGDIIWHPDFYLPEYDVYIEVKGWLTPDAKQKLVLFNYIYPNKKLLIIELKDIIMLENGYTLEQVGTLLDIYLQQLVQQ